ncbi:MAG: DUF2007 domain-containing protein [Nitrospina sp.]|nr:DUF2007 domain-containing protein [Nitrospina sp.]
MIPHSQRRIPIEVRRIRRAGRKIPSRKENLLWIVGAIKMESEFIELGVYYNQLEAEVVRGLLAENDIESHILKDDCGGMLPNLQSSEGVRLHVKKDDLDQAQKIVGTQQALTFGGDSTDDTAETWTCGNCGEVLEPQFTDCWNCGSHR